MASLDDLKKTSGWQTAPAARRSLMVKLWNENPEKQDLYLARARAAGIPNAVANAPAATPTPQPTPQPVPGAVAPGRQMDLGPNAPYAATILGLLGGAGATAAFPGVTIPALAARVAIPALAGAIGGAIDPRDTALAGAAREGAGFLGGEALAKAGSRAWRLATGSIAAAKDLPKLTKTIEDAFPWLKGKIEPSVQSLTKLFRGGIHPESADRIAGQALGDVKDAIETMVGPATQFRSGMTFRQTDDLITELQQKARIATTERQTHPAIVLRKQARELRKGLERDLERISPGAGKFYSEARRQFADIKGLELLFAGKDIVNESGHLDMAALQKRIQAQDPKLAKRLGSERLQKVVKTIGRGKFPVGADIPGQFPIGASVEPGMARSWFHMPKLPQKVGFQLPATRRTGILLPAAEAAYEVSNWIPGLLSQGGGQKQQGGP